MLHEESDKAAFPRSPLILTLHDGQKELIDGATGLTKRELFAFGFMLELMALGLHHKAELTNGELAQCGIILADALLAELEKTSQSENEEIQS